MTDVDEKARNPQSDEQSSFCLKNITEPARFSYESEDRREQSLIRQSGQMLTAFAVVFAAVVMSVPLLLEYTHIPGIILMISAEATLALLLTSMVLALISQWRFKNPAMLNSEELSGKAETDLDSHVLHDQYEYQWIDQLNELQNSKRKNNNKRCRLIHASMIVFFVAVGSLISWSVFIACWR